MYDQPICSGCVGLGDSHLPGTASKWQKGTKWNALIKKAMHNSQNSVSMGVLKDVWTHIVLQLGNEPLEPINMHVTEVKRIIYRSLGDRLMIRLVQNQRVL